MSKALMSNYRMTRQAEAKAIANSNDINLKHIKDVTGGEGRFEPFFEETDVIDAHDLVTVYDDQMLVTSNHSGMPNTPDHSFANAPMETTVGMTTQPMTGGAKHILQEMSIVKNRLGFDEQAFRDHCQKMQSELCQEFKGKL